MAKTKSVFVCSSCGAKYYRWQGICSECGEAGTISETIVDTAPNAGAKVAARALSGFAGTTGSVFAHLQLLILPSAQEYPQVLPSLIEF